LQGYLPPKHEHCVFIMPTDLQKSMFARLLGEARVRQITMPGGNSYLGVLQLLYKISGSPGLVIKQLEKGKAGEELADLANCLSSTLVPSDPQLSGKFSVLAKMLKQVKRETNDKIVIGQPLRQIAVYG
jgi:DNA repair and recombination protein RAD54B